MTMTTGADERTKLLRKLDKLVLAVARDAYIATRGRTSLNMKCVVLVVRADLGDGDQPDWKLQNAVSGGSQPEIYADAVDWAVVRIDDYERVGAASGRTLAEFLRGD